jgi:hypothetical protein
MELNPMGLKKGTLEWHEQKDGGWMARIAVPFDTKDDRIKYRRYAHVNIYDWAVKRRANGMVPLQFQFYKQGYDVTWHEDIDSAKLYAEAIFALSDDDYTDSLIHWR